MNNTHTSESVDQSVIKNQDQSLISGKVRSKMRLTRANAFKEQMIQEKEKKDLQEAEFKLNNATSVVLTKISKLSANKTMSYYDLCKRKEENHGKSYLNNLIIGQNKAKSSGFIKVDDTQFIKPYSSE